MRKFFRKIREKKHKYHNLVLVKVDLGCLKNNLDYYLNLTQKKIAPVLKSNAYGHGIIPVAKFFDKNNLPFLVVDSYYEALVLKNENIKSKILVIGYSFIENISKTKYRNIAFTISSLSQLKEIISKSLYKNKYHLKFDTGMNRQGISSKQLTEVISLLKNNPNLKIEGICSHLADPTNNSLKNKQSEKWKFILQKINSNNLKIKYKHICASTGAHYSTDFPSNVMRLGIGLYGIDPIKPFNISLSPSLSMHSIICDIKDVDINEKIGYNGTFSTKKPTKIAIIPAGYYEGVDWNLSNKGSFNLYKENDKLFPIIGRISMNMSTVDISKYHSIKIGQKVTIISNNALNANSVENIAKLANNLPYEILVKINPNLKRVYK